MVRERRHKGPGRCCGPSAKWSVVHSEEGLLLLSEGLEEKVTETRRRRGSTRFRGMGRSRGCRCSMRGRHGQKLASATGSGRATASIVLGVVDEGMRSNMAIAFGEDASEAQRATKHGR